MGSWLGLKPPIEVFDEGISEWRNSLIGQFIGATPNFSTLQRTVEALWGRDSLLQHKPIVLRKWEPSLKSLDFDLKKMPVWMQLYNVPLELFSKKGLSYIASAIRVPLYMDTITASKARLEFVKACVEVDVGMKIPRIVPVQLKDGSVTHVRVFVPWMPPSWGEMKFSEMESESYIVRNVKKEIASLSVGCWEWYGMDYGGYSTTQASATTGTATLKH
ncbi:hypothetical protein V6N13_149247 [Hibiscus sabdariffa]